MLIKTHLNTHVAHLTLDSSCVGVYLHNSVCVCVYTRMLQYRIIYLLYLLLGIPRLPQTMEDVFVTQEICSFFPSHHPSIHLPPSQSPPHCISLALSNMLSPAQRRCFCPFPCQWRKHKIKPIKVLLWQGERLCVCQHMFVAQYMCLCMWVCDVEQHKFCISMFVFNCCEFFCPPMCSFQHAYTNTELNSCYSRF